MSQGREQDSFWRGRRVFITGCTGFLGSWLTAALLERGAAVESLLRYYCYRDFLRRAAAHPAPPDDLMAEFLEHEAVVLAR